MKNRTLSITRSIIPYVKELRLISGSVTACILMQQMDYWFEKHPNGFYKFLEPCPSIDRYKEGQSWAEELGISAKEFRCAFDKIGIRHTSKGKFDKSEDKFKGKFYCSYLDSVTKLTWYFRNHDLTDSAIDSAFDVKSGQSPSPLPMGSESFTDGKQLPYRWAASPLPMVSNSLTDGKQPSSESLTEYGFQTPSETTPEITSKITSEREREEAIAQKTLSELEEKSTQDQPIADQSASLSIKQRDSADDGKISGETVFAAAPIFPPQKNNATANYEKRFASPHKYPELIEAGYSDIMIGTGYLDFDPIVVEAAVRHLKKHELACEVGDGKRFISNRIKQSDWAAIELLKESAATIANDRKKTESAIAASTNSDEYYDTSRYYVPEPLQIDVEARRKAAESGIAKMKAARAEARKNRAS